MRIQTSRLRADIETNADFGATATENGRTLLTGTDADKRAREYFVDRLEMAGLTVYIDAVGNIVGRWSPDSADPERMPVATGSHLDSVPEGGMFDGPLGVYGALEAVRSMQDAGSEPHRPIEVVSFTEEEGQRFGGGLVGSAVAAGNLSIDNALDLEDSGTSLRTVLGDIEFRGEGRVDAEQWDSWLELHIEQADQLETAAVPAGIVTTISGLSRCTIEIKGEANHAGSTSMAARTDPVAAASEFISDVEQAATEAVVTDSETAVATVGSIDVTPGAPNVIAGVVELSLDVRAVSHNTIQRIIDRARASLRRLETERGVETSLKHPWDRPPVPMAERCRTVLQKAGENADIETLSLHSGAAHDTMHLADVTDVGLLFAPSRNGISHSPQEWTDWDDCADAACILAEGLLALSTR